MSKTFSFFFFPLSSAAPFFILSSDFIHSFFITMAKRKATDDPNPAELTGGRKNSVLPDIMWAATDHELVWKLLTEVEKPENHKVLFGKKRSEVSS